MRCQVTIECFPEILKRDKEIAKDAKRSEKVAFDWKENLLVSTKQKNDIDIRWWIKMPWKSRRTYSVLLS